MENKNTSKIKILYAGTYRTTSYHMYMYLYISRVLIFLPNVHRKVNTGVQNGRNGHTPLTHAHFLSFRLISLRVPLPGFSRALCACPFSFFGYDR